MSPVGALGVDRGYSRRRKSAKIGSNNMVWIAVIAFVAAAAALLLRRKPNARPRAAAAAKPQPGSPFGSVEIQARGVPCNAANAISGARFLAGEAPSLPLPRCDAERCRCRFVKLADRRTEDRRIEQSGIHKSLFLANDRREDAGRRDCD